MDFVFGHFYIFLSHGVLSFENYLYIEHVLELVVLHKVHTHGPPLSLNILKIHAFTLPCSVGQHFVVFSIIRFVRCGISLIH